MPKVTQRVGAQSWGPPRMGQVPWGSGQRYFGTLMGTAQHTKVQEGHSLGVRHVASKLGFKTGCASWEGGHTTSEAPPAPPPLTAARWYFRPTASFPDPGARCVSGLRLFWKKGRMLHMLYIVCPFPHWGLGLPHIRRPDLCSKTQMAPSGQVGSGSATMRACHPLRERTSWFSGYRGCCPRADRSRASTRPDHACPRAGRHRGCFTTLQSQARAALPLCRGGNRLREGQSLARAMELELGADKATLLPFKKPATCVWLWLFREPVMLLPVPSDAQCGMEPRQCPSTENSGVHEMEYGVAPTAMKKLSCLSTKICPRPKGRTKPKQARQYLAQEKGNAKTYTHICLKCVTKSRRRRHHHNLV